MVRRHFLPQVVPRTPPYQSPLELVARLALRECARIIKTIDRGCFVDMGEPSNTGHGLSWELWKGVWCTTYGLALSVLGNFVGTIGVAIVSEAILLRFDFTH
jgi:hypothetical protein